jgi:hypothetical protein
VLAWSAMHPVVVAAFQDELQKIAVDPITMAALGAGAHLGANSAFKAFSNTGAGHRFEAGQLASGYDHALKGQKLNPIAQNIANYGVGPEALAHYNLGQGLGTQLADMGKGGRYRFLKKLRKNIAVTEHIKDAPIARAVVPGINRILDNNMGVMSKLPTVAAGSTPTLAQRGVSAALSAGAIAVAPDTAVHMGLNAIRSAVGNSAKGQDFMKKQFVEGAKGNMMNSAAGFAQDIAVSPGSRYPRMLGEAVAKEIGTAPTALTGSLRRSISTAHQLASLPDISSAIAKKAPSTLKSLAGRFASAL